MKHYKHKFGSNRGFSLTEVMIAILLMGVVSSGAYQFFVGMHQQTISQQQISEMQQTTRATLDELSSALKMAGFKIPEHSQPYVIRADSLFVFTSVTKPVDTTLYYMASYTTWELANIDQFPEGLIPKKLMRKTNSAEPSVFSDYIANLSYQMIDSGSIRIALTTVAPLPDASYEYHNGYRTASDTTQVWVRNYKS